MTARDFANRFKPYVVIGPLVEQAGWTQTAWYTAVSRDRELAPDELEKLREALREHARTINRLARSVK